MRLELASTGQAVGNPRRQVGLGRAAFSAPISSVAAALKNQPTGSSPISPEAVRAQLDRVGRRAFASSAKLFAFCRFVVEEALEGRGDTLKELVIGDALYRGAQPYDPRIDSTVRVEARRLRKKLDAYNEGPGADDEIWISVPVGAYAPQFAANGRWRPVGARAPAPIKSEGPLRGRIGLAVLPFVSLSPSEVDAAFAQGLTDEIIYAAENSSRFDATSRAVVFQYRVGRFTLTQVASETGADLVVHGTIRRCQTMHRVTIEMSDRTGCVMWSHRTDVSGECDLQSQEHLATVIMQLLLKGVECLGM
ncbi:hypothetical protein [Sphingomonas sp. UYP23]